MIVSISTRHQPNQADVERRPILVRDFTFPLKPAAGFTHTMLLLPARPDLAPTVSAYTESITSIISI